jgi:NitT/TauT family transport system permease protein
MQWYLLFNLIEGAKRIPADLRDAASLLGLSRGLTLRHVLVPACLPALVTGSVTGWGGGWNALIVAERIRVGGETIECHGIGSGLMRATQDHYDPVGLALNLVAMLVAVAVLNRIVWHRLYDYAESRFRVEG